MKKLLTLSIGATSILLAANIYAVPNIFSAGQPARAADVNANFADVEQQISNNSVAVYDYRNFIADADVVSKTFTTTGLCGETEVRTRAATPNGANTDITITQRRFEADGVTTCQLSDLLYVNTPTQRQVVGRNGYSAVDDSLESTISPADAIIVATSSMREGSTIANGTSVDTTPAGGTAVFLGVLVDARIIVGLEDIQIGSTDYLGCLKTSTIRKSLGFGEFHRTSWNCPGLGEVKRVQVNTYPVDSSASRRYQMWELSDVLRATP